MHQYINFDSIPLDKTFNSNKRQKLVHNENATRYKSHSRYGENCPQENYQTCIIGQRWNWCKQLGLNTQQLCHFECDIGYPCTFAHDHKGIQSLEAVHVRHDVKDRANIG